MAVLDQCGKHKITLKRMTFLYTADGPRGSQKASPEEGFSP